MHGWQKVCDRLREQSDFTLDLTAGACQARVALLLDHLGAGNVTALRKSGGGGVAAASVVQEGNKGEVTEDGQRRFELLDLKLERKLAEQRRHADEQVRQLERKQRAQFEVQQNQHAQLLATILQQQAMMLDLIKSVTRSARKANNLWLGMREKNVPVFPLSERTSCSQNGP
ncbi:hypothetical protein PsorP6_008182 [Peronosclerospora sorghi]|uniref:Uncharacterized protein n=1 Tax=Peronosclerospora sorghi TaxID=230839 RepID=A0ACC0W9N6_9STRA|nr:hypothetical protein PsorP6_008182 [Peronosclerospora sorghi]